MRIWSVEVAATAAVATEWARSGDDGTPYSHEATMERIDDRLGNSFTYPVLEEAVYEAERKLGLIL